MRTPQRRPIRPPRMRPAARSSAACFLLVLTAAGCAGSSGGSGSGPSPGFHSRALAICRSTQQKVVALGGAGAVASLPELATQGAKVVALQRRQLEQLQALHPPASDAAQFQVALRAMEVATADAARLVAGARRGDPAAVLSQQRVVTASVASANRALAPLGLNTCAG